MKVITASGKSIDEAIDSTLKLYNLNKGDVDILIMDEGKKGFFGIGSKEAIVKIKVKTEKIKDILKNYIEDILSDFGFSPKVEVFLKKRTKVFKVNITGDDLAILIGKHGQTLAAMEHIANLFLNKFVTTKVKVVIDIDGYMQKRRETVERITKYAITKIRKTKTYTKLDPMPSFERRIVHSIIQKYPDLSSYSVGMEPFRSIIIEHRSFNKKFEKANLQNEG
jgi:spoIIIJ-associated protein